MPATTPTSPENRGRLLTTGETLLAIAGFLVLAYFKLSYIRGLLVNSDETQHLHVVWGWTQGLLQYRDLFDNHAPLFHMTFAPLLRWLGERADILYPMRLAMLPLSLACLGLVYGITARLYSRRAGVWAALLAGLHPLYLPVSTEFRTDNLWSLAWLGSLFFLLTGKMSKGRAFTGGLLLGVTLCISLKTTLLAGSLVAAAVPILALRFRHEKRGFKAHAPMLLAGVAGVCLLPLVFFFFFKALNGLDALHYCIFEHNILPDGMLGDHFNRWNFPVLLPLLLVGAWAFYHSAPTPELSSRRAIAFLGPALAVVLLVAYWPLVTRQDFCAILPPLMISGAPALLALAGWLNRTWRHLASPRLAWGGPILALLLLGAYGAKEIRDTAAVWPPQGHDHLDDVASNLRYRLTLLDPDDRIMDAKGETIFRRRPFYYALEKVTQTRLKNDLLEDTIRQDCLAANTPLVSTYRLRSAVEWLKPGYVEIRRGLWVAGQILPAPRPEEITAEGQRRRFTILVKATYRLLTPEGALEGAVIDGKPVGSSTVELLPGLHEIVTPRATPLAIVWQNTERVGYKPFASEEPAAPSKARGPRRRIPTNPFETKKNS